MSDPHVESLYYHLRTGEKFSYDNPPPREYEFKDFIAKLEDGNLACEMKTHYPTVEAAQEAVDLVLRAWEIQEGLTQGSDVIHFVYNNAVVIDLASPGNLTIALRAGIENPTVRVTIGSPRYPDPPTQFHVSADVAVMWLRYRMYLEGREPLLSMAYFCLTVIQESAGGRSQAAKKYNISRTLLDRWGLLTRGNRGDETTARKVVGIYQLEPLVGNEQPWVRDAVKRAIRRLAGC